MNIKNFTKEQIIITLSGNEKKLMELKDKSINHYYNSNDNSLSIELHENDNIVDMLSQIHIINGNSEDYAKVDYLSSDGREAIYECSLVGNLLDVNHVSHKSDSLITSTHNKEFSEEFIQDSSNLEVLSYFSEISENISNIFDINLEHNKNK